MTQPKKPCAYDNTFAVLPDGRCSTCGRRRAQAIKDARAWDRKHRHCCAKALGHTALEMLAEAVIAGNTEYEDLEKMAKRGLKLLNEVKS